MLPLTIVEALREPKIYKKYFGGVFEAGKDVVKFKIVVNKAQTVQYFYALNQLYCNDICCHFREIFIWALIQKFFETWSQSLH